MILVDVNVLVYGFRADAPDHQRYLEWWKARSQSAEAFGISNIVMSGFLRIVTHPRIFDPPASTREALEFVAAIRSFPNAVEVRPGPRHWTIFVDLCETSNARGNLVPDAYLAALAIESGSEWVTSDRGFARFQGLRWRHPFL